MYKNKKYKNNLLRKLARNEKWQLLYNRSKEIGSIRLFKNDINFTPLQLSFLKWLEIYSRLYMEKYLGEELIDDEVIEDDILCDSYLLWKSKNKNDKTQEKQEKINISDIPTVKFI